MIIYMKLNTEKCHSLMFGLQYEHFQAQIGKQNIWEDDEVKLLGITIVTPDYSLKFDTHINNIVIKADQELSVLGRMRNILNFDQRRIKFKSFFEFQVKYCALIWMFCSRKANIKITNFMTEH